MTSYILSLLVCCSVLANAQKTKDNLEENGIYKTGADFMNSKLTMPFNKEESAGNSFKNPLGHDNELWIKTRDSIYKFYNDEIWGYRKNGKDYRFVKNDPYQISYAGKIIIYNIPSSPGAGKGSTVFFSKDISAPVHDLSRKKLLEAYHNDSPFVKKIKEMKWDESIYKWDKQAGHYVFIDWIQ